LSFSNNYAEKDNAFSLGFVFTEQVDLNKPRYFTPEKFYKTVAPNKLNAMAKSKFKKTTLDLEQK